MNFLEQKLILLRSKNFFRQKIFSCKEIFFCYSKFDLKNIYMQQKFFICDDVKNIFMESEK
jgi:hypothetical protein